MKRFKKWMAGIMAVAMLATCMAFAGEATITGGRNTASGDSDATITGEGAYLGNVAGVFKVTLPTGAGADAKIAFTVDPKMLMTDSAPADAMEGGEPNGTLIFRNTTSGGTAADANKAYYTDHSDPLYVTNMSSVNVTVTMFASLSDTKMTILTSGDTFDAAGDASKHLYLAVSVKSGDTADGTNAAISYDNYAKITPLGFRSTKTVNAVGANFKYGKNPSGDYVTTQVANGDLQAWQEAAYMVKGNANANADWDIPGIAAPTLTLKWMVDPASSITYPLGSNALGEDGLIPEGTISGGVIEPAANKTYEAMTDKEAYQDGELVTVYVKPLEDGKKLKSVTFTYISDKDGKFDKSVALKATLVTDSDGAALATNGVYAATFPYPGSLMAKSTAKEGATIKSWVAPYFTIVVG